MNAEAEEDAEEGEGDGRAEDASAVNNGSKAAMPVEGSGNNMRGKIKHVEPAGGVEVLVRWTEFARRARKRGR